MIDILRNLVAMAEMPNLTDYLSEEELVGLGKRVVEDADTDEASRKEWTDRSEKAMELALQVAETKTFPWTDASNVHAPLLTEAALHFHARVYPSIIQGGEMVKGRVVGEDPSGLKSERADRVCAHMNWQLSEEMPEWEEQTDKMLLALPIEGTEFKKIYYCPEKGRNVSEWVRPKHFIVNDKTKSLEDCPRATHILYRYPNQIAEAQRAGIFREVDLNLTKKDDEEEQPQELYEQYRLEDLDEDGIKEPYIVLVHKDTGKVLRIKANYEATGIRVITQGQVFHAFVREGTQIFPDPRIQVAEKIVGIDKESYFVKYPMFPSPDGGFYDVGYGQLTAPLIEAINSILNQIIDAGTLANAPPGLIAEGLRFLQGFGSGEMRFEPGEMKKIKAPTAGKIADMIYQFQFPGPSMVLFQTLGALIDQVKAITSISDVLTGEAVGANEPVGTTLARIEQGMKIFNASYKRIYRSLNKEFKLLYRLNSIYMNPQQYFNVVDSPEPIEIKILDYQGDETDIRPVADPTAATTSQKMAKAQFLMSVPVPNQAEALKRLLKAAEIEGIDELLQIPEPEPDPKQIELEAKLEKMEAETQKLRAEMLKIIESVNVEKAKVMLQIAEKEAELGTTGSTAVEAGPGNEMVPEEGGAFIPGVYGGPVPGPGQPVPYSGTEGL